MVGPKLACALFQNGIGGHGGIMGVGGVCVGVGRRWMVGGVMVWAGIEGR